jgi:hypothetical protein
MIAQPKDLSSRSFHPQKDANFTLFAAQVAFAESFLVGFGDRPSAVPPA